MSIPQTGGGPIEHQSQLAEYQELGEEGPASSDQKQKLRMFESLADFLDRRVGTIGDD